MSLFAVGGANSAIPEMHRVAVDVHHWMTDRQFADVLRFRSCRRARTS
jgi:chromate transporter